MSVPELLSVRSWTIPFVSVPNFQLTDALEISLSWLSRILAFISTIAPGSNSTLLVLRTTCAAFLTGFFGRAVGTAEFEATIKNISVKAKARFWSWGNLMLELLKF
jgi:hypothetical protein